MGPGCVLRSSGSGPWPQTTSCPLEMVHLVFMQSVFCGGKTGCLRTEQLGGSSLGGELDPKVWPFLLQSLTTSAWPQGSVLARGYFTRLIRIFWAPVRACSLLCPLTSHYIPGTWAEQACDPHFIDEEGGAKRVNSFFKFTSWTHKHIQCLALQSCLL